MVKITNGKQVFTVTAGAYNNIYKAQGFTKVDDDQNVKPKKQPVKKEEPKKEEPAEVPFEEPEEVETEEVANDKFAELLEKPISQWSNNELKDFAAENDIDLSGTKNAKEAKSIIKEYLAKK